MSGNLGLRFAGIANMLDREYRNTPKYQWARELVRNGIEADATRIQLGVEWQAVKAKGVYRLQYADNGVGMDRDQLRDYMHTLGKGSKIVGGPHDNYALGCRMTLLPWNAAGVVVISQVEGGQPNMVKFIFDSQANDGDGEYVLVQEEWEESATDAGSLSTVYPPYIDEEEGFNWADTIPDIITQAGHGTTFILMGANPDQDTIDGDPSRNENLRELGRKYFNTRFWEFPENVQLRLIEFINKDRRPTFPGEKIDGKATHQWRTARGASFLSTYQKAGKDTIQESGVEQLEDGTRAHWWLRHDTVVDTGGIGGSNSGFMAVLYRGELYGHAYANREDGDTRIGTSVYRQFGIGQVSVRQRVFVILEPPEFNEHTGAEGVAPSTGRADLYWMGTGISARSVKVSDWAEMFGGQLPQAIQAALRESYDQSSNSPEERQERLKRVMDRFSKRWESPRAKVKPQGSEADDETSVDPKSTESQPRQPIDAPNPRPRHAAKPRRRMVGPAKQAPNTGLPETGTTPAVKASVRQGYPEVRWVTSADIDDAGMIAAWQAPSAANPDGLIDLDEEHPLIRDQIRYWQDQYPPGNASDVERIVRDAYEEVAIAKITHMHSLRRSRIFSEERSNEMLQNPALTTSLLGLISEDALISPRLGGLGAKRKRDDS